MPPTPPPRYNKTGALLPQCAGFVYGINVQEKGNGWKLKLEAIPHNFKCRYGERGAAAAKQKAQRILCVFSSIFATQTVRRSRWSGA